MAKYTEAELQIVAFDAEDVITTSDSGQTVDPDTGRIILD
jgi:hypothetical protein